jgi:hypothetical protein
MTMFMNAFEPAPHATGSRDGVTPVANARSAMIRQICLCALGALAAGAILAAIIALETAFYLRAMID